MPENTRHTINLLKDILNLFNSLGDVVNDDDIAIVKKANALLATYTGPVNMNRLRNVTGDKQWMTK